MKIGSCQLKNNIFAAPMAGISDAVFRKLATEYGAGLAVSEMISADTLLKNNRKTQWRLQQIDSGAIRSVQIVGHDPSSMAQAARYNVDTGAQIIDINMGCPAKKVCNRYAGSALLADPEHVRQILDAVVRAVDVPVTLKIRTGIHPESRNGVEIALIAEQSGIQALSVHGRTRACRFKGEVEYETIAAIKRHVAIPVIANGDIDSAEKAEEVLARTGADGVMIGRAAQGQPWVFRQVSHWLHFGCLPPPPSVCEISRALLYTLENMYKIYGEYSGVRIARKHIGWYTKGLDGSNEFRKMINLVESSAEQFTMTSSFFQNKQPDTKIAA